MNNLSEKLFSEEVGESDLAYLGRMASLKTLHDLREGIKEEENNCVQLPKR